MTKIHHLNCGWLEVPGPKKARAACHCLLLEGKSGLALVDTGIGLLDVRCPEERIGPELIKMAGFLFEETDTAVRQIERLGYRPANVMHIVLTHGDPDHAGGLADVAPYLNRFFRTFGQRSSCLRSIPGQHSRFEQFEPGPAIHLALDGL